MRYFAGSMTFSILLAVSPLSFAADSHAKPVSHLHKATKVAHVKNNHLHHAPAAHINHKRSTHLQKKHHKVRTPTYAPETPVSFNQGTTDTNVGNITKSNDGVPEIPNRKLVDFVLDTVNHQNYSSYKFGGTRFDVDKGIYELDCSTYVDHVLADSNPQAYDKLVSATGTEKPTSSHFYDFFTHIQDDSQRDHAGHNWSRITDASELLPGDILVFRYHTRHSSTGGGHVMIVMDKPVIENQEILVKVADAAPTGHSEDTRPSHASGIGIGTLLLKVNKETFSPSAFAWKVGSRWQNNVRIAMGRPAAIDAV